MDIDRYVREAREKGMSDDAIRSALLNMGQSVNDINARFSNAGQSMEVSTAASNGNTIPPVIAQPGPSSNGLKPQPQPQPQQTSLDSIGSLFGATWRLYKERFLVLIGILIVPTAVIGIGTLMMSYGFPANIGGVILIVIGYLVFVVASVALVFAVAKGTGVTESYRGGIAIFWSVVWIGLLIYFAVMGGMVMLVIPGIMLAVWFLFSNYILVIEGKRGLGAMSQSREYTRGYWWSIFGRYLLLAILAVVIVFALYLPALFIFGKVVGAIVYFVLLLFVMSFSLVYLYELYLNLAALKPELAASQSRSGRGFFITSAVIGLISPFVIAIAMASLFSLIFLSIFKAIPKNSVQFPPSLVTVSVPSPGGTATTNSCNDNDMNCLIAAAQKCSPASLE